MMGWGNKGGGNSRGSGFEQGNAEAHKWQPRHDNGVGVPWVHDFLAKSAGQVGRRPLKTGKAMQDTIRRNNIARAEFKGFSAAGSPAASAIEAPAPTPNSYHPQVGHRQVVGYQAKHAGGENSTAASWESGTRGKNYKGKHGKGFGKAATEKYAGRHRNG